MSKFSQLCQLYKDEKSKAHGYYSACYGFTRRVLQTLKEYLDCLNLVF
jgi:hypothetical protein